MSEHGWTMHRWLKRRLLVWIGGLWIVGMVAALLALWHESAEVFDSALVEVAQAMLTLPESAFPSDGRVPPGFGSHREHVVYQVYDAQGAMRLRSHAAPVEALDPDLRDGVRAVGRWHVLTLSNAERTRRVQVAESYDHRIEAIWASALLMLLALLLALPLCALAINVVLRKCFATLDAGRAELEQRTAGDLRPLQPTGLPLEMRPWLDTVNALMARVQSMLESERSFAAHTAHELRTPLAAARAQAQRLAATATAPVQIEKAQALVRQLDQLGKLATRLLQLARIESGVALRHDRVDLIELAQMVVDEFADARRPDRVRLQAPSEPVPVDGDIDALGIALRNLIDNALKHGGDSGPVTVRVEPRAISVVDDGPGVSPHDLPRLSRKFERGQSGSEGAGLGLAMVTTIARQSNATLELRSPLDAGRGFRATLRFAAMPTSRRRAKEPTQM